MSTEPSFPTRVEIAVQWGDVDRMQHVNNVVFFRWMETARTRYFEEIGLERHAPGRYAILASLRCDFRAQLRYPEVISAECSIVSIGRTSATHRYRIVRKSDGKTIAEGEGAWVLFDYSTQKSSPFPEALVGAIERHEGGSIRRRASRAE